MAPNTSQTIRFADQEPCGCRDSGACLVVDTLGVVGATFLRVAFFVVWRAGRRPDAERGESGSSGLEVRDHLA